MLSDPSDALSELPAADRLIAELKALAGDPLSKAELLDILRSAGFTPPDGGVWTVQKLSQSLDLLVRKRVLTSDHRVAEAWRERLILDVVGRPKGSAMIAALLVAAPKSLREDPRHYWRAGAPHNDVALARSVRLKAMLNDEAGVERLLALADEARWSMVPGLSVAACLLGGLPADPAFVRTLSAGLRGLVASAHVEWLIEQGVTDAGVDRLIAELADPESDWNWTATPALDLMMLRLDLMAERPDAARGRIVRVRGFSPIIALAAEAALTFLTAPDIDSVPLFREALKQYRKTSGSRRALLPREFALYHILALLASGGAGLHGQIDTLLTILQDSEPAIAFTLSGLLMLASGRADVASATVSRINDLPRNHRGTAAPLEAAIFTLALAVMESDQAGKRQADDRRAVENWGRQAVLPARILSRVHTRFSASKGSGWPNELTPSGDGYARDFLAIVPIKPVWERSLDALQAFLAPPDAAKSAAAVRDRRLIFLFDAQYLSITALEQTAKRGVWSGGRPVALKRLHKRDPKLDYLTPDDHRVLAALAPDSYPSQNYSFHPVRGPLALVGHPRIFDSDAPERPIELIRYPAELVVREEGDLIRIDLSHRATEPRLFVEPETANRWRLVEVTAALVDLGAILGPSGLTAPKEARDRVIALIRTDNPRLPVRAEMAGVETEAIEGDVRPILRIAPDDGGFTLQAVVRPLGDNGPAYAPGVGSRSVLVPTEGVHRRINRNLEGETEALERMARACPALASWRESDHLWRIETIEDALEALQQLRDFDGPLTLEWPEGQAIKPTRNVEAQSVSLTITSARDWFEIKGQVQVDEDLVLDMAVILDRLGSARGRFVPLDGGRYLALTEDLRRRLDAFAAATEGIKGGQRIGVAAASAVDDLVASAGAVTADRRWSDLMEKIALARGFQPELPTGLEVELRDYQLEGYVWLARLSRLGLGACLADDMGLGKTVQTLALLLADAGKGPSLVVAPTSVCHNWLLEAGRFAPGLRVRMLSAAPDRKALVESLVPGDLLIASYGLLHTEADLLASRRFAVVVFDEAQNLKNAETRRARASKRMEADFRLALSGTPVENRLEELWSLYDTVTPGLLGSRESFHRRFIAPVETAHAGQARQALKTLIRPYLLRRTKAAVLSELPPRTEITLEVEPDAAERAFYEALRRNALEQLARTDAAPGQKRIRILAEITRLRRAACHPALIDPDAGIDSAKLAALLDLIAELRANRHRALVFSQFTGHLDLAQAALEAAGARLLRLDGSTPAKERARLVDAFQAGEGDLFLISLKAGGTGLNLTGADYVIHLDPWWNPAVEDQATDRAHRIGQTRPVTVYRLVVKDSIEQQILALHASKRALSADVLDGSADTGALDEDQLMALIRG